MKTKSIIIFLVFSTIIETFSITFSLLIGNIYSLENLNPQVIMIISVNIVSMIICLLSNIGLLIIKSNNYKKKLLFSSILMIVVLILLFSILVLASSTDLSKINHTKIYILFYYLVTNTMVIFIWFYEINLLKLEAKKYNYITLIALIFWVINAIFLIFDCLFNICYSIDESGKMSQTNLIFILAIYPAISYIISMIILIKNKPPVKKIIPFVFFVTLPTISHLFRIFTSLPTTYLFILISVIMMFLVDYINQNQDLIEKDLEIKNQKLSITYSQIEPHFLFNSLQAIMGIDDCGKKTREAIADFGDYLRGNLNLLINNDLIPFEKELEHTEAYLKLEELRSPNKIKVIFNLEEKNFDVPQISLQILIENAFKHAFINDKENIINVKSYKDIENYIIEVNDNGIGFDIDNYDKNNHLGLANLESRLKLMCKGKLIIESKIDMGTKAKIIIPREQNENISSR